jgi:hypothetical protein
MALWPAINEKASKKRRSVNRCDELGHAGSAHGQVALVAERFRLEAVCEKPREWRNARGAYGSDDRAVRPP